MDATTEENEFSVWCDFHWLVVDYFYWVPANGNDPAHWQYWFSTVDLQWIDNCHELECC